ncbi:MAG: serine--tRNA ligase [Chlamydiales bacterium]|nr:serine--tRNA ligase [Chlamydiales bacterium]
MLDIKLIRKEPEAIAKKLQTKVPDAELTRILELDTQIREKKTRVDQLKATRNTASDTIGQLKRKGENTDALVAEMTKHSDEIHALDRQLTDLDLEYVDLLARLPNLPMDDIKVSLDPKENVEVKSWGKKPEFAFSFKHHVELNEKLKLFDFERGAKLTGSGWPIYCGNGARLEWALINYMIDYHVKDGWQQIMPPITVKREGLYSAGQLPKFENQQYKISEEEHPLYLIPTAEVALNGMHCDEILPEEILPLRYVAYIPCFRREAGAAGSTERGLIRMHQFNKVEMFSFCTPEQSDALFKEMVARAEGILEGLELHYRSMLLVTGDMSFASSRTIDVEVWLPGQNRYYEVSSISNCTDYQSRRGQIRYRKKNEKPEFVHTLNGSGLATSRLLVAILENNQQADGSVIIPKALRPYMGGMERLTP